MHRLICTLALAALVCGSRAAADDLRDPLMKALGDRFEFVSGEFGEASVNIGGSRFWFAKVRPKQAGEFAISYTTHFDKVDDRPDRVVHVLPFSVGQRGAPRIIYYDPHVYITGSKPHLNVGDVLVIPIHAPRVDTKYTFADATNEKSVRDFFEIFNGYPHEYFMKRARETPMVVRIPKEVELIGSWRDLSTINGSRDDVAEIFAYLKLACAGEFRFAGRRIDKSNGRDVNVRVLPADKPVTVPIPFTEYREYRNGNESGGQVRFSSGTPEAHVGDHLLLRCGVYFNRGNAPEVPKLAEVVTKRFLPVPFYRPEKK